MARPPIDDGRMPASACLSCGDKLDACTGLYGAGDVPHPGDITICLRCGNIMAFADDLSLRELNDREAHAVAGNPKILAAQAARVKVMEGK